MQSMKPDRDICVKKIKIPSEGRDIPGQSRQSLEYTEKSFRLENVSAKY